MRVLVLVFVLYSSVGVADIARHFSDVKQNPLFLRDFLRVFPKGGDLHNHLQGAIYAESYIEWGARDKKCVELSSSVIGSRPWPCADDPNVVSLRSIRDNDQYVNKLIDAYSMRNGRYHGKSGHDDFFSSFMRFYSASIGREGDMLAEAALRADRQNILYLELMQSFGMIEARSLAVDNALFNRATDLGELDISVLQDTRAIQQLRDTTRSYLDNAEARKRTLLGCDDGQTDRDGIDDKEGCNVGIRYLAQVIRTFPREQVLAQTLLAFMLVEADDRYVGINFVAPEDHPISLRDYSWQMNLIGNLADSFPKARQGIALHAGELAMGLVPPEDLRYHINEAVFIAGARRIGHGVSVIYERELRELLEAMQTRDILVEINLTSNEKILGISGQQHPFELYRRYGVPLALSTDDEGVSRVDLTHEYQKAVETYDLGYKDIKLLSRNSLAYSFVEGESLFTDHRDWERVDPCLDKANLRQPSGQCQRYLSQNSKAKLQWLLERNLLDFEESYQPL